MVIFKRVHALLFCFYNKQNKQQGEALIILKIKRIINPVHLQPTLPHSIPKNKSNKCTDCYKPCSLKGPIVSQLPCPLSEGLSVSSCEMSFESLISR